MKSLAAGVLIGLGAGIVGVYLMPDTDIFSVRSDTRFLRDIGAAAPMENAVVLEHRASRFSELQTIASLQTLPSDFVRSEALYALSNRSNAEELVILALDAARIMDPHWRDRAYVIVFQRLTETEPDTALKLARSDRFFHERVAQATVLQTWARLDLMAAAAAVSGIEDNTQHLAAQMLYSGIGGAYTHDALLVEEALGISPSRSNRDRFVRNIFGVSADAAIDHVMELESKRHQHEQIESIAKMLSFEDIARAEELAERIEDDALRRTYLGSVFDRIERDQPLEAAKKRFAIRGEGKVSKDEKKAFEQIMESDIETALRLYADLSDDRDRESLGLMLAAQYAKSDAEQALHWAGSAPESVQKKLVNAVIVEMAEENPALALQEAGRLDGAGARLRVTHEVMQKLAGHSPRLAAEHINQIEDNSARSQAANTIARKWLAEDPFAAVDWLLSSDTELQASVFSERRALKSVDLYDAQALIGALPAERRGVWARDIADRLISERSPDEAIRFVSQFSGQDDYDMQMAHVVAKIAEDDGALAEQWVDRIPGGHPRDGALSTIVRTKLRGDPADAVAWIERIDDADLRQDSAGSVATAWFRTDPAGARRWIDGMPRGEERDNVLVNAAASMLGQEDAQLELIESIDDVSKRQQAMFIRGMMNSRDDPEEVIRQLEQIEMPEFFKQQIKAQVLRQSVRGQ